MSKIVDDLLGFDGKDLFGGVHTAGKILASAFGAGQLAQQVETLESPILPDWAKSNAPSAPGVAGAVGVQNADYVTVLRKGAKAGDTIADVAQVIVVGGKRFDGTGYQHGEPFGKRFSFGYDSPSRVDFSLRDGKKMSINDVDKVIFCGGTEAQAQATKVSGEVVGFDWWAAFYNPAQWWYEPAQNTMNPSSGSSYKPGSAVNQYWAQQRAAQQPFSQQRKQSGMQLQQALRAEQAARAAAALAQLQSIPQSQLPPPSLPQLPPILAPDSNYQAPAGAETQRSEPMSDDLNVLGEQALRDLCGDLDQGEGDLGRRGLEPGDKLLGDLGLRGLELGLLTLDGVVGDLGLRGLEFGLPTLDGDLGRRGLQPGVSSLIVGEMGRRGLEPGVTVLGAEYLYGCDVLGAPVNTPRRSLQQAGITVKTTPKGRTFTSLVLNRQAKHNPKQTLATLRTVAKRMNQIGQRGLSAAKTLASRAQTSVKGAVSQRRAAPKMAPAALRRMAEDLVQHGKKLGETANKYEGTIATFNKQQTAVQKRAQAVTKVRGFFDADAVMGNDGFNDTILGDDDGEGQYFNDIVGAEYELLLDSVSILGAVGDPVPDPTNPGFMTDGTPDPGSGGGAGAGATGATPTNMPGPPDYGAGSPPTAESIEPQAMLDYQPGPPPETDMSFYDCPTDADLPLGAIIFDGSRLPPFVGLGNYTVFQGMLPDAGPPKGGPNSGYEWHGSGGFDWALVLQGTQPSFNYSGGKNFDKVDAPGYAMVTESQKNNWGPLMGNPQGGWTRGLRFSPSGPNGPRWFWFYDQAPDWAKQPIRMARLNDAIAAYAAAVAAGKTDFVNQQIQDQLDAQDAAKAAKAQALVDATVAQQQEIEAQRQAEADARAYEQQQALDMAAQRQTQQFQAQQDAAAAAYLQAHPETLFEPVYQGEQQQDSGDGGGLPSEMSDQSASDDMTPPNLDDQQIDWNG